jgi:hypothetical protein
MGRSQPHPACAHGTGVWPDAGKRVTATPENEQRLLKLVPGRATYNGKRTGRPAARQPRKPRSMSVQPQHQNSSRALVSPGSADRRPSGAPAYYLGRPASLWIGITSPARQAQRTRTACRRHHR